MALLFCDGFDTGDLSTRWTLVGGPTATATTRFSTGKASSFQSAGYIIKSITASSAVYLGFAYYATSISSFNGKFLSLFGDGGTTEHIMFTVSSTSPTIIIKRGDGTVLGSYGIQATTWLYLEVYATIADSGGVCQLRINGNQVISYTGDTKNGGTNTTIDTVRFGDPSGGSVPGGLPYIDDFYICNSTGSVNNSFLGDIRVLTVLPTAAGASTQFTPTSGANYTTVNDVPDVTTSYNASSTVGQRDTFTMADIGSQYTVLGAQNSIHAWKSDAGTGNVKIVTRTGATNYYGSSLALGTSVGYYGEVREVNPATSAQWTYTDINGLETGYEVA